MQHPYQGKIKKEKPGNNQSGFDVRKPKPGSETAAQLVSNINQKKLSTLMEVMNHVPE
jgi:hypothetical protein